MLVLAVLYHRVKTDVLHYFQWAGRFGSGVYSNPKLPQRCCLQDFSDHPASALLQCESTQASNHPLCAEQHVSTEEEGLLLSGDTGGVRACSGI